MTWLQKLLRGPRPRRTARTRRGPPRGGGFVVTSRRCGGFGCFYDSSQVDQLQKTLLQLDSGDVRAIIIIDSEGRTVQSQERSDVFTNELLAAVKRGSLGIRVEGMDVSKGEKATAVGAYKHALNAFGENLEQHTTYRYVVVAGASQVRTCVVFLQLQRKLSYEYNKSGRVRRVKDVDVIGMTLQQSCRASMYDVLESTRITPRDFQSAGLQIRNSLRAYHSVPGCFHGDLKWENMVVCDDGVKLIDFPSSIVTRNFSMMHPECVHTFVFRANPPMNWPWRIWRAKVMFPNEANRALLECRPLVTDVVDGQMYDKILFNTLFASYVHASFASLSPKQKLLLYQGLHFPEATRFIIHNKLIAPVHACAQVGIAFIRHHHGTLAPNESEPPDMDTSHEELPVVEPAAVLMHFPSKPAAIRTVNVLPTSRSNRTWKSFKSLIGRFTGTKRASPRR
jgi:hypothetical protein